MAHKSMEEIKEEVKAVNSDFKNNIAQVNAKAKKDREKIKEENAQRSEKYQGDWDKMGEKQVKIFNGFIRTVGVLCLIVGLICIFIDPLAIVVTIAGIYFVRFDARKRKSEYKEKVRKEKEEKRKDSVLGNSKVLKKHMETSNKVMASTFGVGGATVDTIVHTKNIMPGKRIEGICKIKGGNIEQHINDVSVDVYTSYKKEVDDKTTRQVQRIQEHTIKIDKSILPDEVYEVKFSFILYKRVPVTMHKTKVWLSTYLDIKKGKDTSDRDYINVGYNDYMQNVIDAVSELGFSLREVENEYSPSKLNGFNFIQEFEFVPTRGEFRGRLDELELVFIPKNTHVDILLEVDRKVRGIGSFINESMGLDETKLRIRLENSRKYSCDEIKNEIERLLRRYS